MPAAVPIAIAAGMGSLSGGIGAAVAGTSVLTGVLVGGGLGAAMGGIGLLLQPHAADGPSNSKGPLTTNSVRNIPVPVIFGTAKVGGNYIALGEFWTHKDGHDGTPGVRNREMHAYIGLCEGPVQALTDFRIDGKTIQEQVEEMELDAANHFSIKGYKGTSGQGLPPYLADAQERGKYGFTMADPIPWRNTAILQCGVDVGTEARLCEITCKVKGPDLSIRRKGRTGDASYSDVVGTCHYDGYSESYYATLTSSARNAPFGLLKVPREKGKASQTHPPAAVTKNIAKGWYLGKHDVLLMQDPDDPATFHLGTWGIARESSDWEEVTPDPGYAKPILFDLLDELNGCLHTIHQGATNLYVMRWNLLTGWITRLDLDVFNTTLTGFTFAPDSDAYILGTKDDRLILIDANKGTTYHTSQKVAAHGIKGLCVGGSVIGLLFTAGCIYYDPFTKKSLRRYGAAGTDTADGNLGGIGRAVQNTWTGHVTAAKPIGGDSAFVSFIPSILTPNVVMVEKKIPRVEKVSTYRYGRLTTTTRTVYDTKKVKEDRTDYTAGWTRDWSWRMPDSYSLHALEGEGSVAAALWNTLADEPSTGSARWGAGLSPRSLCLSSFEALHAYCVGPVLYPHKNTSRYVERYQFHFNLDSERSVTDFVANEILLAINGYRTLIDGRLHVGVQRTALAAAIHFTADQIEQDSGKVAFLGRAAGANRIRIEFPDANDDYNRTFGEANDEYDQNARGRVVSLTLSASGITRLGHARTLAQQLIDAVASNRRQVSFKTHWLGFVLSPGDGIEITDPKLGLDRYLGRVTKLSENENNEIEITAIEHQPVRDLLAAATVSDEDSDAGCAALATSAEYRHNLCMTPMHAAVYEDPENPILIPLAALSPKTRLARQIRIDYRYAEDAKWTSLGKVDSAFGGFLARNLSTTAQGIVIDGVHGTSEKILGDLPVLLGSHEALGIQTARAGGDETALATSYSVRNQGFGVRRVAGQAWNARSVTVQYAYRVHALAEEEGCFKPALYLQGLDACDQTPQDAYIPYEQVPAFPFYFHVDSINRSFLVKTGDGATDEPGTIYPDWRAVQPDTAGCPYVCGFSVQVANGLAPLRSDFTLDISGRFNPNLPWSQGAMVMGDQTLLVEISRDTDYAENQRNALIYPTCDGQQVPFDDGTTMLQSCQAPPTTDRSAKALLTVKSGERIGFSYECWNTSESAMTTRVCGPIDLPLDPLGTPNPVGMPPDGWALVSRADYPAQLLLTLSGITPADRNGTWILSGAPTNDSTFDYEDPATCGSAANWHLVMQGQANREQPAYWSLVNADLPAVCYQLTGSEGICSPLGIWRLEPLGSASLELPLAAWSGQMYDCWTAAEALRESPGLLIAHPLRGELGTIPRSPEAGILLVQRAQYDTGAVYRAAGITGPVYLAQPLTATPTGAYSLFLRVQGRMQELEPINDTRGVRLMLGLQHNASGYFVLANQAYLVVVGKGAGGLQVTLFQYDGSTWVRRWQGDAALPGELYSGDYTIQAQVDGSRLDLFLNATDGWGVDQSTLIHSENDVTIAPPTALAFGYGDNDGLYVSRPNDPLIQIPAPWDLPLKITEAGGSFPSNLDLSQAVVAIGLP